jgi:hypothetical protein
VLGQDLLKTLPLKSGYKVIAGGNYRYLQHDYDKIYDCNSCPRGIKCLLFCIL